MAYSGSWIHMELPCFFVSFFFVLVELWVRGRFLYGLGESHRHYQLPTEPNAFSAQLFR